MSETVWGPIHYMDLKRTIVSNGGVLSLERRAVTMALKFIIIYSLYKYIVLR